MTMLLQPLYKDRIVGYTIERSLGGGLMVRKPQYPSIKNQQAPIVVRQKNASGLSANIKISYKVVDTFEYIPDFGPIEANIEIVDIYDKSFSVSCENANIEQNNTHYIMAFANIDTPVAGFITDEAFMERFQASANIATDNTDIVNINAYFDGNVETTGNPIVPGSYYTLFAVARSNRDEWFHDPVNSVIPDMKAYRNPEIVGVTINVNT